MPSRKDFNPAASKVHCFRLLSVCLAAGILSGCAGYKLGPTNGLQAGTRSIQISPFVNQTFEPRLGDAVTAALRKTLQRDGTFRLSTRAGTDIAVSGVVTKYTHQELSFVPEDVLTVRDFRVGATVQVTARDVSTGNILLDRPVTGYTLVRVGSDLTSAERQALGPLADEVARKVTALLVDGTW